MKVIVGEMSIELTDDEFVEALINYVNYEESNDDYHEASAFELCNVAHDRTGGEIKILLGERKI